MKIKLSFTVLFVVCFVGSLFAQDLTPFRLEGTNIWGFKDASGKVVIHAKYNYVNSFSEGLAMVRVNERSGYINTKGEMVIEPQFFYAYDFKFGVAIIRDNNMYGAINQKGKIVIPTNFQIIHAFSEGMAAAKKDNKFGFIDTKGKWVIPNLYQNVYSFYHGVAAVQQNNLFGYINAKGEAITKIQYRIASNFTNGKNAYVSNTNREYGYIDITGKEIIPFQYKNARNFSECLAWVMPKDVWGAINEKGEMVIEPQYSDVVKSFENGIAEVKKGDFILHIDSYGKVIKEVETAKQKSVPSNNLPSYVSFRENGKLGLKDNLGKVIVPPLYDNINNPINGYIVVAKDKKFGALNMKGEVVLALEYENVFTTNIPNQFSVKKNEKFVLVSSDGKEIPSVASAPKTSVNSNVNSNVNDNSNVKNNLNNNSQVASNETIKPTTPGQTEYEKGRLAMQEKNYNETKKWMLLAAEKGNLYAMYSMGLLNDYAIGNPPNYLEAKKWYEKGAEKGIIIQCTI
ncbi:MAG: SEL1-like repeat protein [Flavobacterium sp.]